VVKKINLNLEFYFIIGMASLLPYLFFKHINLLYFSSIFFFFTYVFIYVKRNNYDVKNFLKLNTFSFLFLLLFITSLFISVLYSPIPSSSLDKLITVYLFNIIIFVASAFFFKQIINQENILKQLEHLFLTFTFLIIIYLLLFSISSCSNLNCIIFLGLSMQGLIDQDKSLFIGLLNLASTLTFLFSILLFFYLKHNSISKKFFFLILSYLIFILLIWLGRRAALLGLFIGLSLSCLIFKFKKELLTSLLPIFLSFILLLSISTLRNNIIIRSDKIDILISAQKEKLNEAGSLGLRLYEWDRTLKKLLENPLKGTGLGRKVAKETFYKDSLIGHPHNTFISLAIQSGVQSLIFFLAFYLCILIKIFKMTRTLHLNKTLYAFNVASFVYLIAFFVIAMFSGLEEKPGFIPFWIFSGAVLGIYSYIKSLNIL